MGFDFAAYLFDFIEKNGGIFYHGSIPDPSCIAVQCEGWNMMGQDGQEFDTIDKGVRDANYDKCVLFSPKLVEINYGLGCHVCNPVGGPKIKNESKLLHYCNLGEEYIVNRRKKWRERMSQFDRQHGMGYQYLFSEEKMRQDYRNSLAQSVKVL